MMYKWIKNFGLFDRNSKRLGDVWVEKDDVLKGEIIWIGF